MHYTRAGRETLNRGVMTCSTRVSSRLERIRGTCSIDKSVVPDVMDG